jgi:tRNA uridine 5-carbamoylmethylation protein Kti12
MKISNILLNMHIVLLCGYKGSGKDIFAKHLESKYEYTHMKISQPLKESVKILFDFNEDQIEGNLKDVVDNRWNITPRDALIYIGTDIFQSNIKRSFWINILYDKIQEKIMTTDSENIVVSDLRFLHELSRFQDLKYKYPNVTLSIVKIVRPNLKIYYNGMNHESETDHLKFKFDKIIENNDVIEEYHKHIDKLLFE